MIDLSFLSGKNDQVLSISCGLVEYFASLNFDFFSSEMHNPAVMFLRLDILCIIGLASGTLSKWQLLSLSA